MASGVAVESEASPLPADSDEISELTAESDEVFDFFCNTCAKEDNNREAVDYCSECKEYFCNGCLRNHNAISALKDHQGKLLGMEDFKKMTITRHHSAPAGPHSPDDLLFACSSCIRDGTYHRAVDYCRECSEYMCKTCLKNHNKTTKHGDKLLKKRNLDKMMDARNTLSRASSFRSMPIPQDETKVIGARSATLRAPKYSKANPEDESRETGSRPRSFITSIFSVFGIGRKDNDTEHTTGSKRKSAAPADLGASTREIVYVDATGLTPGNPDGSIIMTTKLKTREPADKNKCFLSGICCLPDGGWLLADRNNKVLKRLDRNNRVVDRCDFSGCTLCGVCYIPGKKMTAVATGDRETIELVSTGKKMERSHSVKTRHHCNAVACYGERLYVSAFEGHEVYEYNLKALNLNRVICPKDQQGAMLFSWTRQLATSNNGKRLYVADWDKGVIVLDTETGSVIQEVDVGGCAFDICLGKDDLFVRAMVGSWKIIRVGEDGRVLGTVVTHELMGGHVPCNVSYQKKTARLAVTVDEQCDYMFVCEMK